MPSLFRVRFDASSWMGLSQDKLLKIASLSDFRDGMGLPMMVTVKSNESLINHPDELFQMLEKELKQANDFIILSPLDTEHEVLIEEFIQGMEFSCIVVRKELRMEIL